MTELELYKFVTDDGGYEVTLGLGGVICVELNDICEMHEINPEHILEKN